ncbi:hypothetical protein CZ787_15740 [Halomonas citrativorans]|uniref:Uncharacterized protein n=1 Tax=Halomonas citrativorans TaxID=2742612 RepID=A0A1R4I3W9_9GAMM|nr:hypothetical protein CZ787_15740 [Halomonas citrativorans]
MYLYVGREAIANRVFAQGYDLKRFLLPAWFPGRLYDEWRDYNQLFVR